MKYTVLLFILGAIVAPATVAQTTVHMSINTEVRAPISPYIYGSNAQSDDREENIAARRIGGNRLTGYNWENNASNAGSDWQHSSDNYLTWLVGIPASEENKPGIVLTSFHDTSLAMGTYSLVTLPMAGYVAKDKNGNVAENEKAPSPRWARIVNRKGAPFSTAPDVSDDVVYTDELMSFLIGRYGTAQTSTGIQAYSMDNEPALWTHTHPRLVPGAISVKNLVAQSIDMARTIKAMDPSAHVFGPAMYGFNEYRTLQDAPDWNEYSPSYKWFVDVYLDSMQRASQQVGTRLLDVFDVHWYPELAGVYAGDKSREASIRRMQAPRSLWDSSYIEESWIGQWFSPVAILHQLQYSINTYYPGTKLAITEYNYGAPDHISGGIAQADVLGIFGRMGLHFASRWGALDGYVSSAFRLFRNYDGQRSAFGSLGVRAETTDDQMTSVYASVGSDSALHIILLNKDHDRTVNAVVNIDGGNYGTPAVWKFDQSGPEIDREDFSGTISAGILSMQLPPLSAYHLVLPATQTTDVRENEKAVVLTATDNGGSLLIRYAVPDRSAILTIADLTGRIIYSTELITPEGTCEIPLGTGAYFTSLLSVSTVQSRKVVLLR